MWTHHEPELRAFVHACIPQAAEVDEVMQEVSLAAWRKFPMLTDHALFPRWACLIARYEILMARRHHARGRLVLDEDIVAKLAEEGAEEGGEDEEDPEVDDPRYSADPECLLARRRLKGTDVWSYLVRWKGLSEEWDCWVDAEHLDAEFVARELEETESDRPLLTARAHADLSARAQADGTDVHA